VPRFEVRHFETPSGRDPIRAFLEELTSLERAACDEVIGFLERDELALHPRNSDYLGGGLWELRVAFGGRQFRFLYSTEGPRAYLLVAFVKKTQQTPSQQIQLARKRLRELHHR
jgi:phage-related protein